MATVTLTKHLFTFFPQLEGRELVVDARTAADVQAALAGFFGPAAGAALLEIESDMATNRAVFQAFRGMAAGLRL